jgi:hypothetical protein
MTMNVGKMYRTFACLVQSKIEGNALKGSTWVEEKRERRRKGGTKTQAKKDKRKKNRE